MKTFPLPHENIYLDENILPPPSHSNLLSWKINEWPLNGWLCGWTKNGWLGGCKADTSQNTKHPTICSIYKPTYMRVQNENYTIGFKGTVLGDWGRLKSGMELCVIYNC